MATSVKLLSGPNTGRKKYAWVKPFLSSLRRTACIAQSVQNLNGIISERAVHQFKRKSPVFRKAVQDCLDSAIDLAAGAAFRRGVTGFDRPIIYKGQLCFAYFDENNTYVHPGTPGARPVLLTEKEFSDACLLEWLRKRHPDFKEKAVKPIASTVNVGVQVNNGNSIAERIAAIERVLQESESTTAQADPLRNGAAKSMGGEETVDAWEEAEPEAGSIPK